MNLKYAILETLAYSDVFDFPLTIEELHRFLVSPATQQEILACLVAMDSIRQQDGYFFFESRGSIVALRKYREMASKRSHTRAIAYGRILGHLPFVRMVALTGSLAVRNCDETGDYDYMLVAKPGRVWMARIFALLVNKVARVLGETLCPNLIVSEDRLKWEPQNLYSAREIAQMTLISGQNTYRVMRIVNGWIFDYLPNLNTGDLQSLNDRSSLFQRIFEFLLGGSLGDKLEAWEMKRKIAKLSRQDGFGIETNFNADICQGNFSHHAMWTMQKFEDRLEQFKAIQ